LIKTVAPFYHAAVIGIFAQAFFEKACGQTIIEKACVKNP